MLQVLKFQIGQFKTECFDYRDILKEFYERDWVAKQGIYAPDLDSDSAIIRIPARGGFLVSHNVMEMKKDTDGYLDSYTICGVG